MRTFDKSAKLDNVLYDVRGPVVDEAAKMEEEGKEILKLNIGNPYPHFTGLFGFQGYFFCPQGDHAVCTASRDPECDHE